MLMQATVNNDRRSNCQQHIQIWLMSKWLDLEKKLNVTCIRSHNWLSRKGRNMHNFFLNVLLSLFIFYSKSTSLRQAKDGTFPVVTKFWLIIKCASCWFNCSRFDWDPLLTLSKYQGTIGTQVDYAKKNIFQVD